MRILAGSVITLLLVVTPAPAQLLSRQFSNPAVPSRQALDRLNLALAWRVHLPVGGRRDGIFSVQLLEKQILVQMISGLILSLDADTGAVEWKTRVGTQYRVNFALGYNKKSVYPIRGRRLFSVDRVTGQTEWKFDLHNAPSAAPVADEEGIYVCLGANHIHAYILQTAEEWLKKKDARDKAMARVQEEYGGLTELTTEQRAARLRESPLELDLAWDYVFEDGRIQLTPLQTADTLTLAASNGLVLTMSKFTLDERYRFKAEAPIMAPLGQHGEAAYIASHDYNLYALNIPSGKTLWRFTAGAPLLQKPEVLDRDVFVVADRRGLFRLDRESGEELWHNREAQRFLAMNRKFVYATDRIGRLLVLDQKRGTRLGLLNTRDFVVSISNERSDRVFLASHSGLLVCLRDYNQKTPLANKNVVEKKGEGFRKEEKREKEKEEKAKKDREKAGKKLGEEKEEKEDKKDKEDKKEKE